MTLFDRIWQFKGGVNSVLPETPYCRMEAVLKRDVEVMADGLFGPADQIVSRIIPAGTKVRVWTSSRFGWVGISDDLTDACNGYDVCLGGSPELRNPGPIEDWLEQVWVRLDTEKK